MLKITNFKLGIGIPCSWSYVPVSFFDSFIQMDRPDFIYLPAKNGPINEMRNRIVEQALTLGCSHLLMMDTDQIYPKDTITRLLSHGKQVVHGQVHRRYPPFDNLMYSGTLNNYTNEIDYADGELVKVDACGTGCVLYHMNVFRKIKPPWFEFTPNMVDEEMKGVVGEDIGFCEKLRKINIPIFVDTSIKVAHLTMFSIDENFSILYQSLVKRQMIINEEIRNNE